MMAHKAGSTLTVSVPAKINLWLEVISRREDGYHELSSLMVPISVYDRIDLTARSEEGISVGCDRPDVPCDSTNLAWKAASAVIEKSGVKCGMHIEITKRIPVGAGLGGGSANAGAVLLGVNRLLGAPLTAVSLHEIAAALGADVPFFLHQRPTLATGIGERLEPVDGLPAYPLVLMKPPLSVSTRWVYQSLKLTRGVSRIKVNRLLTSPWCVQEFMENDLESVTLQEYPVLAQMKEWLMAQGALGALMSGSGPTVFSVFSDKGHAQRAAALCREKWADCWVAAAEALSSAAAG